MVTCTDVVRISADLLLTEQLIARTQEKCSAPFLGPVARTTKCIALGGTEHVPETRARDKNTVQNGRKGRTGSVQAGEG